MPERRSRNRMKRASSPSTVVARAPKSTLPYHLPVVSLRPISTGLVDGAIDGGSCAKAGTAAERVSSETTKRDLMVGLPLLPQERRTRRMVRSVDRRVACDAAPAEQPVA